MKLERNFRDLGGYYTHDNKKVKNNILYRSSCLSSFDKEDLDYFKNLNVKTILDLRTSYEAYEVPDPRINNMTYFRVSGMRDISGEGVDYSKEGYKKMSLKKGYTKEELEAYKNNLYTNMVFNNQAFMFFIHLCKNESNFPLVFHCASGKDRTGALAILIYLLLGVSKEDILKDYLLSNCAYNTKINNSLSDKTSKKSIKEIYLEEGVLFDVGNKMLDEILNRYLTYDEFFLREYKIDVPLRDKIRKLFLSG